MNTSASPFGNPSEEEGDDDFNLEYDPDNLSDFSIPEGDYDTLICIDVNKSTSGAGNPMWVFDFRVHKPDDPNVHGHEIKNFCTLTPNAMWKASQVLEALGLSEKGKVKMKKQNIIGRCLAAKLETQEYQGTKRSVMVEVYPHGNGLGWKIPADQTTP